MGVEWNCLVGVHNGVQYADAFVFEQYTMKARRCHDCIERIEGLWVHGRDSRC